MVNGAFTLGSKVKKRLIERMNRLAPLIVRRTGPLAPGDIHVAAVAGEPNESGGLPEDLKLFALAWLGGFVFFGTLFG